MTMTGSYQRGSKWRIVVQQVTTVVMKTKSTHCNVQVISTYIYLTKAKNKASVRATLNCAKCFIMISTAVIA